MNGSSDMVAESDEVHPAAGHCGTFLVFHKGRYRSEYAKAAAAAEVKTPEAELLDEIITSVLERVAIHTSRTLANTCSVVPPGGLTEVDDFGNSCIKTAVNQLTLPSLLKLMESMKAVEGDDDLLLHMLCNFRRVSLEEAVPASLRRLDELESEKFFVQLEAAGKTAMGRSARSTFCAIIEAYERERRNAVEQNRLDAVVRTLRRAVDALETLDAPIADFFKERTDQLPDQLQFVAEALANAISCPKGTPGNRYRVEDDRFIMAIANLYHSIGGSVGSREFVRFLEFAWNPLPKTFRPASPARFTRRAGKLALQLLQHAHDLDIRDQYHSSRDEMIPIHDH
jgi:hypothetical protein